MKDIKNEDIFIKTNSLTNMIKGKKIREAIYNAGIKFEIEKISIPNTIALGFQFNKDIISFTIYHSNTIEKNLLNNIIDQVSEIIWKRHDIGHHFKYVEGAKQ